MRKLIILGIVFLISIAYSIQVCPNSVYSNKIQIYNPTSYPVSFNVYVFSENGISVLTDKNSVIVDPKSTENLTYFVYIPPNIAFGNYTVIINVDKEYKFNFEVINCHKVILDVPIEKAVCAYDYSIIPIKIKNIGNFSEELNIKTNFGNIEEKRFLLESGEEKDISLIVLPEKIGTYEITINLWNGFVSETKKILLRSLPCDDFTFEINKQYIQICEGESKEINLLINNIGIHEDRYFINWEGPGWINLENKVINLKPFENKTIKIYITPICGSEGSYSGKLKIRGEKAKKTEEIELDIKVKDCYKYALFVQNVSACENDLVNIPLLILHLSNKSFNFSIETNYGETINNFVLKRDVEVPITLIADKSKEIKIKTKALAKCGREKEITSLLKVFNNTECYGVSFDLDKDKVYPISNQILKINGIIKNIGKKTGQYKIEVGGELSSYVVAIEPAQFRLSPGESKKVLIILLPKENKEGEILLNVFEKNNLIYTKTILFTKEIPKITGYSFKLSKKEITIYALVFIAFVLGIIILTKRILINKRKRKSWKERL